MAIPTALDPSAFLPALPAPEADGAAALGLDGLRAAVRAWEEDRQGKPFVQPPIAP